MFMFMAIAMVMGIDWVWFRTFLFILFYIALYLSTDDPFLISLFLFLTGFHVASTINSLFVIVLSHCLLDPSPTWISLFFSFFSFGFIKMYTIYEDFHMYFEFGISPR